MEIPARISVFICLFLFFLAYFFYQSKDFIFGPKIVIFDPPNNFISKSSHVIVQGQAEKISSLYLDGRQIFTHEDGGFKEDLLLASGYNIIEVAANDKFGRKIIKQIAVVVKDD